MVGTLVPVSVGLALGGVGDRLWVTVDSDNVRCVAVTLEAEMVHEEVQLQEGLVPVPENVPLEGVRLCEGEGESDSELLDVWVMEGTLDLEAVLDGVWDRVMPVGVESDTENEMELVEEGLNVCWVAVQLMVSEVWVVVGPLPEGVGLTGLLLGVPVVSVNVPALAVRLWVAVGVGENVLVPVETVQVTVGEHEGDLAGDKVFVGETLRALGV
mmetsp:Transcript_33816/g.60577  ORF Transcript_33816/g.60577 Transcript_33816/m.60577 type:complete len:213 (+) Transcript_33816:2255-2893(+)